MAKSRHQEGSVEEAGKRVRKWRGHYYVYIRQEDGSEIRRHKVVTLGPRAKLKKFEAEQKLREIIRRDVGAGTPRADDSVTMEWFWTNRFVPMKNWRVSTRNTVKCIIAKHVLPRFGSTRLGDLRKFELQTHVNSLAKDYSKSLVNKVRVWVKAILDEAVDQEYLSKNPATKLALPETRGTCKRFLTPDEYRKMLSVLTGRDRLIFRLFVVCAFRPGELFALRWRCFQGQTLRVEETVYKGKLGAPKTESSAAVVSLPDSLSQELLAWYQESGNPPVDAFIFPSRNGTPLSAHNYLRRDVLKPAAKSVGIKGLTFQSLRRTFATHFHRIGTVKDQQSQMRHSDAQTTINVYTQSVSESLKKALEEFDRKMSESF